MTNRPIFDIRHLEAVAERISALLPEDPKVLRDEFRANLRPVLEAALRRMDLVTREEFDAQTRVLARTREKLEALERQIAALEQGRQDDARDTSP